MKSNNKIYLVVFVVLVAFVVWDFQSEKKENQQKTANLAIFNLKQDQIENIQIASAGSSLELKRTLDGWQLVKPIQDEADSNFVEDFLQTSFSESAKETIKAEQANFDWKIYGLDNPNLQIKLTNSAGQSQSLQLSEVKNFEKNIYARLDKNPSVLVVPSTWLGRAKHTAFDFRDRRLYRGSISAIIGFTYSLNTNKTKFLTKEERWQWVGNENSKLEQNRVREFLSQINETKFASLESQSEVEFQKAYNSSKLKLSLDLQLTERTWFADMYQSADRLLHVRVKDSKYPKAFVGTLEAQNNSKFLSFNPQEFRDRSEAFAFDKAKVSSIKIRNSLKNFALKKQAGQWVIEASEASNTKDASPVDQKAVQILLDKVAAAKIIDFKVGKAAKAEMTNQLEFLAEDSSSLLKLSWGEVYLEASESGQRELIKMKSSAFSQIFSMDQPSINLWGLTNLIEKKQTK